VSSVVRFRTATGEYAVAVEHARQVRTTSEMISLPSPRAGVVGLLPDGDDALTVVDVLGSDGEHVLVLEAGGAAFGLLVQEVLGVNAVEDKDLGPAPSGQRSDIVSGIIHRPGGLVLLVDVAALARTLAR